MSLAREFHHPCKHRQHPRRHTADICHILVKRLPCDAVALQLKIRNQCSLFLGHTHKIGKRVDVFDKNGTEVTHDTVCHIIIRRMASSEDQCPSVEETAFGVICEIHCHGILTSPIVGVFKSLGAYGNKLALVVGGARGFGIPFHCSRPEHVSLSMPHSVDVTFQFLVCVQGGVGSEILISLGYVEKVFSSVLGVLGRLEQRGKHMSLHLLAFVVVSLQFLLSRHKNLTYNTCQTHIMILLKVQK